MKNLIQPRRIRARAPKQTGGERQVTAVGWVETRAAHISDPLERLKYLRRTVSIDEGGIRVSFKWVWTAIAAILLIGGAGVTGYLRIRAAAPRTVAAAPVRQETAAANRTSHTRATEVWPIDYSTDNELYSNGLRIENQYSTPNRQRSYVAFRADRLQTHTGVRRSNPIGIVFHATESRLAPFEAGRTATMKRAGKSMLEYVARRRAYNFVIDRFGRVYRVVPEQDAANHAGHSVWSDGDWLYVNLNDSFIGIAFEARTWNSGGEALNPAQLHSGAVLVDMLRSRYKIAAGNCVTHAQVSVNPRNARVGYHTDWAASFPFTELGLPDNYRQPLPAVWALGFHFDPAFLERAGSGMYLGVGLAEERLRSTAQRQGLTTQAYRKILATQYKQVIAALRDGSADEGEE